LPTFAEWAERWQVGLLWPSGPRPTLTGALVADLPVLVRTLAVNEWRPVKPAVDHRIDPEQLGWPPQVMVAMSFVPS
jgi:hypothetical protein